MGVQGLEAQLLREVVAEERGELEEAKERLMLSLAADTRQLQDLQDRILKLLKVPPPPQPPPPHPYLCPHTYVTISRLWSPSLCGYICVPIPLSPHLDLTQPPRSVANWLHMHKDDVER